MSDDLTPNVLNMDAQRARAARLDIAGVLQHVIIRGVDGRDIFCGGHNGVRGS